MVKPRVINVDDVFSAQAPNIYTMPSGTDFIKNLAYTLRTSLGDRLREAMIFLPTRRAARGLADAFLDLEGGEAVLLPTLRTLADMDENEPPFAPGDLALQVPQAISDPERHFALSKLVAQKMGSEGAESVDAAAALAATTPLLSVLNDMASEALPLSAIKKLESKLDLLPAHQQNTVAFIDILSDIWPKFLNGKNLIEPTERRVQLLNVASEKWRNHPPDHPVIVAGSTGTLQATAGFIKTVANLPNGLVVLPGLDLSLDEEIWSAIDDQHPQAALRRLLLTLGVEREHVAFWPGAKDDRARRTREHVLAESLIPVESTADWPSRIARVEKDISEKGGIAAALKGLTLIEAHTSEEEAAAIALIMREALHEDKECALVTPDPSLARRVRAKLSRFGIEADSSAGEPLEETAHGVFLSLILTLAGDPYDPVALGDLYTHALYARQIGTLSDWYEFEALALRGARARSMAALQGRLDKAKCAQDTGMVEAMHEALRPLADLIGDTHGPRLWAKAHTQAVETMAGGADNVWRGEAGEKAAAMLEELLQYGDYLPATGFAGYVKLISTLMRGRVVRPRYGTEKRLKILGPLEARMLVADTIILGGLNEGVWPAHPAPHPLLSRGMRKAIGLHAPERRFGQSAHDFAELANHPNVIMTRSERGDDGPQVMSRWLWRLTTLVKGAAGNVQEALATKHPYLEWARHLDPVPDTPALAKQPEPRPAVERRWPEEGRRLSVTQIQKWIRDPYSIYADKVLNLDPLDLADLPLGGREFGTAVHRALELGLKSKNHSAENLLRLLISELDAAGYQPHHFARLAPNLEKAAAWVSDWVGERRAEGWVFARAESKGEHVIVLGEGHQDFTLSGIADLIETRSGEAGIIDFKTGSTSTKKTIEAGFDPQLPLLAVMAEQGAFCDALTVTNLSYVKPNTQEIKLSIDGDAVRTLAQDALETLKTLIINFDDLDTAYYSQPRAQYTNTYGDFDHLARRTEWAALADEKRGGHD